MNIQTARSSRSGYNEVMELTLQDFEDLMAICRNSVRPTPARRGASRCYFNNNGMMAANILARHGIVASVSHSGSVGFVDTTLMPAKS